MFWASDTLKPLRHDLFFFNFIDDQSNINQPETERTQVMITDPNLELTGFLQKVSVAVRHLKQQLQRDYEKAYPQLGDIIHLVVDEEESHARELSLFPHLVLPDLVEAHIEKLNLEPARRKSDSMRNRFRVPNNYEPVFGICA